MNPSPVVHQSMPSVALAFCSPVRHVPDFTNCTTQTRHPAAAARIAVPNAAVDFPLAVAGVHQDERGRLPGRPLRRLDGRDRIRSRTHWTSSSEAAARRSRTGHDRPSGLQNGEHAHPRAVVPLDRGPRQHLVGAAAHDHPSVHEERELIGVLPRQRQVVHRGEHGEAVLPAEIVDEIEHLLLTTHVQGRRRLVEQEDRRLLGQRPADHGPPSLAAAQRPQLPGGQRSQLEPLDDVAGHASIASSLPREVRQVRRPPEEHVLRRRSSRAAPRAPGERARPVVRARAERGPAPARRRERYARRGPRARRPRAAPRSSRRRSGRSGSTIRPAERRARRRERRAPRRSRWRRARA